jgi:PREDICTED: similar to CG30084 CG30084-PF
MTSSSLVTKHVEAPVTRHDVINQVQKNLNICEPCGGLITGVFCRVRDKNFHSECFKCTTCGTSLKNIGYFNINDKLYCDAHAKQAASLLVTDPSIETLSIRP